MLFSCASLANSSISEITVVGLLIDSTKIAFVSSFIAF